MKSKNILLPLMLVIAGIVVGAMLATAVKGIPVLAFLAYSRTFGISTLKPLLLNLSVLRIVFGAEIDINVAEVLCVVAALLLYRKFR